MIINIEPFRIEPDTAKQQWVVRRAYSKITGEVAYKAESYHNRLTHALDWTYDRLLMEHTTVPEHSVEFGKALRMILAGMRDSVALAGEVKS
jgi:hypothetical protein